MHLRTSTRHPYTPETMVNYCMEKQWFPCESRDKFFIDDSRSLQIEYQIIYSFADIQAARVEVRNEDFLKKLSHLFVYSFPKLSRNVTVEWWIFGRQLIKWITSLNGARPVFIFDLTLNVWINRISSPFLCQTFPSNETPSIFIAVDLSLLFKFLAFSTSGRSQKLNNT